MILFLAFALFISANFSFASGSTIQAGEDIQTSVNAAKAGDTIIVGPGDHNAFTVDRPLNIEGQGQPVLRASIQMPAIKINCDGVTISGFKILGSKKDTVAKFNYYMQNPTAAAGSRLDQPNAALVVHGNNFLLKDSKIFGAQVGILAENADSLTLQNTSMDSCDTGASLIHCSTTRINGCSFSGCKNFGLNIEQAQDTILENCTIANTSNAGALFKGSVGCSILGNVFSKNTFGLSLWGSSNNQVRRNHADHNYYGILVTDSSNNNTIADNMAQDNRRSEIAKGFGIGISLQENSSNNMIIRNTARGNFNGLEISRGCKFNAVFGNDASDNSHGIRLNENRNNLIFGNNFYNNNINAYENSSLNIWNTTFGNYYSDYRGKDENGDGIGEQPYTLPGPESETFDYAPQVRPYRGDLLDMTKLGDEVKKYARYGPDDKDVPPYRMEGGKVVISSRIPTKPPKWPDSKPLDLNDSPF